MSDGEPDVYRDQKRSKEYDKYLAVLAEYSENPNEENFKKVKLAAKDVDNVPAGWDSRTNLSKGLKKRLKLMVEKNKK